MAEETNPFDSGSSAGGCSSNRSCDEKDSFGAASNEDVHEGASKLNGEISDDCCVKEENIICIDPRGGADDIDIESEGGISIIQDEGGEAECFDADCCEESNNDIHNIEHCAKGTDGDDCAGASNMHEEGVESECSGTKCDEEDNDCNIIDKENDSDDNAADEEEYLMSSLIQHTDEIIISDEEDLEGGESDVEAAQTYESTVPLHENTLDEEKDNTSPNNIDGDVEEAPQTYERTLPLHETIPDEENNTGSRRSDKNVSTATMPPRRIRKRVKHKYCKAAIMILIIWGITIVAISFILGMDSWWGASEQIYGTDGDDLCTLCGENGLNFDEITLMEPTKQPTHWVNQLPSMYQLSTKLPSKPIDTIKLPPENLAEVCAPSIHLHDGMVEGCIRSCMPALCCLKNNEDAQDGLLTMLATLGVSGTQADMYLSTVKDCYHGEDVPICNDYNEWCATLYSLDSVLNESLPAHFETCSQKQDSKGDVIIAFEKRYINNPTMSDDGCGEICNPLACCYDNGYDPPRKRKRQHSNEIIESNNFEIERRRRMEENDCQHFSAKDPLNAEICNAYAPYCSPSGYMESESLYPSHVPSRAPSQIQSLTPSIQISNHPSNLPTSSIPTSVDETLAPSLIPSSKPSSDPSSMPSYFPSLQPTISTSSNEKNSTVVTTSIPSFQPSPATTFPSTSVLPTTGNSGSALTMDTAFSISPSISNSPTADRTTNDSYTNEPTADIKSSSSTNRPSERSSEMPTVGNSTMNNATKAPIISSTRPPSNSPSESMSAEPTQDVTNQTLT